MHDTIVAISTPNGHGGIGIVRLSGTIAYSIALQISKKKKLVPRIAYYSTFKNYKMELIDQGLIIFFKNPCSFTGEDIIEFQIHGSPVSLNNLLETCVFFGARLANPGEFSKRAFLNKKIDLLQAESIADLIASNSKTAHRMAMRSLSGQFGEKIKNINQKIIDLRLFIESEIDFPEEEISIMHSKDIIYGINKILIDLHNIYKRASQGMIFRENYTIVITGKTNVGKSTLMNVLSQKNISIVTNIEGTTRDVIKSNVLLDDISIQLVDTAGININSKDLIEKEGINRAWNEIKLADIILLIFDIRYIDNYMDLYQSIKKLIANNIKIIIIFNKIDLTQNIQKNINNVIYISAKNGIGLNALREKIKNIIGYSPNVDGQFLARKRHLNILDKVKQHLLFAKSQICKSNSIELVAEDLRISSQYLEEITGKFTSYTLLEKIFSTFCIGK